MTVSYVYYVQQVLTDIVESIIDGASFDWLVKGSQHCVDGQQKYGNNLLMFCSKLVEKLALISLRDENDGENMDIFFDRNIARNVN